MEFEGRARIRTQLDVAPLVDVVFLLLIFFLLTSTFMAPEAIELSLPTSSTARPSPDLPVVVSMGARGGLRIGDREVSLQELQGALDQALASRAQRVVRLKADASVELQRVLEVMDRIRAAGASELSLATRAEPQGAPETK